MVVKSNTLQQTLIVRLHGALGSAYYYKHELNGINIPSQPNPIYNNATEWDMSFQLKLRLHGDLIQAYSPIHVRVCLVYFTLNYDDIHH